jgi:hypothetical protein
MVGTFFLWKLTGKLPLLIVSPHFCWDREFRWAELPKLEAAMAKAYKGGLPENGEVKSILGYSARSARGSGGAPRGARGRARVWARMGQKGKGRRHRRMGAAIAARAHMGTQLWARAPMRP